MGDRYQHYLESVLEGADEFHEIGDLILRHATLAATNQDLKEQRNHFGEAAEQTRSVYYCVPFRVLCCSSLQVPFCLPFCSSLCVHLLLCLACCLLHSHVELWLWPCKVMN